MEPVTEHERSSSWADLPPDLVGEISGRLSDAADYVRFHAVCTPWHEATLPSPAAIRPRFLPWLLNDLLRHQPLNLGRRRISSLMTSRSSYGHGCDGVPLPCPSPASGGHRNWVASADGTAAWFLTVDPQTTRVADLVTGAITAMPPLFSEGMEKSRGGIVYPDGTIFVYSFGTPSRNIFRADILRPGDVAWTSAEKTVHLDADCHLSAAYHDGKILVCMSMKFWFVLTPDFGSNGHAGGGRLEMRNGATMDGRRRTHHNNSYVFESRGDLMWVTVVLDQKSTLSVTVHVLAGTNEGGKMSWVAMDGKNLMDRVLFLGSPASFTADATRLGVGGGCAYFVFRSCVFRYNLINGVEDIIEQLPPGWSSDKVLVWLQPNPTIAPICEIRAKLEPPTSKENMT